MENARTIGPKNIAPEDCGLKQVSVNRMRPKYRLRLTRNVGGSKFSVEDEVANEAPRNGELEFEDFRIVVHDRPAR